MAQIQHKSFFSENFNFLVGMLHKVICLQFPSFISRFHDREDIVQQSLLVALKKYPTVTCTNEFNWLIGIAKYECRKLFDRWRVRKEVALESLTFAVCTDDPS